MSSYVVVGEAAMFAQSRQRFEETVSWLIGTQAGGLSDAVLASIRQRGFVPPG